MSNTIIKKEEFDELYKDDIAKKRYDAIIEKIESRVHEILHSLDMAKHIKLHWYCYENGSLEEEDMGGYFDPESCTEYIKLIGAIKFKEHMEIFSGDEEASIPVRWLWEQNYLEECSKARTDFDKKKNEEKLKLSQEAKVHKEIKTKMIASIKTKLSTEELKFISFK